MAGACAAQLAHRMGMPCDAYGLCTSASQTDPQYANERFANAIVPALAGADILSGVGGIDSGLAGGFEIAVIDDEMISLMKHIAAGCEITEQTLAFDVIKTVVLRDGVFLAERHTVQHMRSGAIWTPVVSDRKSGLDEETRAGVVARARARAREILRTHRVEPLPDDVTRHLDEIMARARRELVSA